MKRLMTALTVLFVFSISAFAETGSGQGGNMMGNGQGSGMMGGGWGWGMNSGWFFMIIIAILVIFGIVYMIKRR
jgi:uncharacterized membrane protein